VTQDDDHHYIEFGGLSREREQQSRALLERIDQLDAEIAAAGDEKTLKAKLERDQRKIRQEFAEILGENTYADPSSSRFVKPIWRVTGVPSKKSKEEATVWMAQRSLDWDGSAPRLRYEVRKALKQTEPVPDGKFGLHVERTVDIELPWAGRTTLSQGRPNRRKLKSRKR